MHYTITNISDDKELNGHSFVGVSKQFATNGDGITEIVVPYGLHIDSTTKDGAAFLRRYVKCIQKALSSKHVKERIENVVGMHDPLSAVNLIYDYLSQGKWIEYDAISKISDKGKIDFNQTIKKIQPKFVDGCFFYDSFYTKKRKVVEDSYLALLQCNVINDFMDRGGDVLFGQALKIPTVETPLDQSAIIRLQQELSNTFNSRKENIIRWCIDYIKDNKNNIVDDKDKRGNWNYAIIASTLWEEMVDAVFSSQKERNKREFGKMFYSLSFDNRIGKRGKSSEHDTIFEDDEALFIIDAKMYGNAYNLLSSELMEKQFGYYNEAKNQRIGKPIVNVLLRPQLSDDPCGFNPNYGMIPDPSNERLNPSSSEYNPRLRGEFDPDKIAFDYTYPTKALINDYFYGRKKGAQLKNEFVEFISQDKQYAFLSARHCAIAKLANNREIPLNLESEPLQPSLF